MQLSTDVITVSKQQQSPKTNQFEMSSKVAVDVSDMSCFVNTSSSDEETVMILDDFETSDEDTDDNDKVCESESLLDNNDEIVVEPKSNNKTPECEPDLERQCSLQKAPVKSKPFQSRLVDKKTSPGLLKLRRTLNFAEQKNGTLDPKI